MMWQVQYHVSVGFNETILYVRPRQMPSLLADPGIMQLLASGQLILVLWDHYSLYAGWLYLDMMLANAHASLSYWGRHARLFFSDADEFLVPAKPRTTLADMAAPGGCLSDLFGCSTFNAFSIRPEDPSLNESMLWKADLSLSAPHPLLHYGLMSPTYGLHKSIVDPNLIFPFFVHSTLTCNGTTQVADGASSSKLLSACSNTLPCSLLNATTCGWVAHVANMHGPRVYSNDTATPIPADWLWMLQ